MEFQLNCINFSGSCITNRLLIERPQTLNLTCFYSAGGDATTLPENAIRAHPDFRMIVLANRPGFPFLGNDFFGSLGKSFFQSNRRFKSSTVLQTSVRLTFFMCTQLMEVVGHSTAGFKF